MLGKCAKKQKAYDINYTNKKDKGGGGGWDILDTPDFRIPLFIE